MMEPVVKLYLPNGEYGAVAEIFRYTIGLLTKPNRTHDTCYSSFNFGLIDSTLLGQDTSFGQGSLFLLADDQQSIDNTVQKINDKLKHLFDTDRDFDLGSPGPERKPLKEHGCYETPVYIPAESAEPNGIRTSREFTGRNNLMISFLQTLGRLLKEPVQRFELAKAVEEEYFNRRVMRLIH